MQHFRCFNTSFKNETAMCMNLCMEFDNNMVNAALQVHGSVLNIASLIMPMQWSLPVFNFASSIYQYLSVIMKFKAIYHISFRDPHFLDDF